MAFYATPYQYRANITVGLNKGIRCVVPAKGNTYKAYYKCCDSDFFHPGGCFPGGKQQAYQENGDQGHRENASLNKKTGKGSKSYHKAIYLVFNKGTIYRKESLL